MPPQSNSMDRYSLRNYLDPPSPIDIPLFSSGATSSRDPVPKSYYTSKAKEFLDGSTKEYNILGVPTHNGVSQIPPSRLEPYEAQLLERAKQTIPKEQKNISNLVPIIEKDETFHGKVIEKQIVYSSCPVQDDGKFLMSPKERRQLLQFEIKSQNGRKFQQAAKLNNMRHHLLLKHQYPSGVPGVDGPTNSGTTIYNDENKMIQESRKNVDDHDAVRRQILDERNKSSVCLGLPPEKTEQHVINHGIHYRKQEERTFEKIFASETVTRNAAREQFLRNEKDAGRPYNIINNTKIEYLPPTIKEKQRKYHESMVLDNSFSH